MAANADKAGKAKRQYYCVFAVLVTLFVGLQYKLWFSQTGFARVHRLQTQINGLARQNESLTRHNREMAARLAQWKSQKPAQESLARSKLGMIKENEVYYQFVGDNPQNAEP